MEPLRIAFPPPKPKSKDTGKLREILNAVCAILNSFKEGGKLIVFSESRPYSQKDADDITRKIEQKLQGSFGQGEACKIITKIPSDTVENVFEMCYEIRPSSSLPRTCTVNYNLFCTSNTQVHCIPSSDPIETIIEVIKGKQKCDTTSVLGTHQKEFSYGARIALEEGKGIQLKLLEETGNEKTSLAERMTNDSNKLTQYVSGFANGNGGHIYYGIGLREGYYVVYGQAVNGAIRGEIITKVKSTLDKLFTWPGNKECLKKGEHWDIYFEKVLNTEESRYVVVISVNGHDRGVFVKEPESYIVDDGKVKAMDLCEWTERFLLNDLHNIFPHKKLPRAIGRCKWSSPEAFHNHIEVLNNLVILRNDGLEGKFTAYKKQLCHADGNTQSLIQQQEAGNFFRKKLLKEAEAKLIENETLLNEIPAKCVDAKVYQVRRLYWLSVVKRAQGDYDRCRDLCEEALQASHNQPTILVLSWIYYNRAKILEIEISKLDDPVEERSLRTACMQFYESALRSSFALYGFPEKLVVDLQQRVLIAMAGVSLGAFSDGEQVIRKECFSNDIKQADYLLDVIDGSAKKHSLLMTKLSKAEYCLVRAELWYRKWEEDPKPEFIEQARKKSTKAAGIAKRGHFSKVSALSKRQLELFERICDEH